MTDRNHTQTEPPVKMEPARCPWETPEKSHHQSWMSQYTLGQPERFWIYCSCGATGPKADTVEEAFATWSLRTPAQEPRAWWPAGCEKCGWVGKSTDAAGGGQIADSGDYDDAVCPECVKNDGPWLPIVDLEDFFREHLAPPLAVQGGITEGYRTLNVGETVQKGDEGFIGHWFECEGVVGMTITSTWGPVRRRLSPATTATGWQPMEAAPKDGTEILLLSYKRTFVGRWLEEAEFDRFETRPGWQVWKCDDGFYSFSLEYADGWMPLPPAPSHPPYPHNLEHPIGTCADCGKEMRYNVPRLGPGGGFVHVDGGLLCAPSHPRGEGV